MNYKGNKKIPGVYHKIINEIPTYKNYYELFAGSCAIGKILMKLQPDNRYFFNDLDKTILKKHLASAGIDKNIYTVLNDDAIKILKSLPVSIDSFIFLDPPYLYSTRNGIKYYKFEMTDKQHLKFLAAARSLKINCMIIHPKCELYDNELKGWRQVIVKIKYHNKTSIECLYMNYEQPKTLQTDIFLGKNFTDRQRIKRKAERFVNKFSSLPELERKYILSRIAV